MTDIHIHITDNSHYCSETCHNGGDYSFTTIYTLRPDNKFDVTFSTSSEFPYCPLCGSFYQGDSCPCGMDHPDIVDRETVNKAISDATQKIARGENWEIAIE